LDFESINTFYWRKSAIVNDVMQILHSEKWYLCIQRIYCTLVLHLCPLRLLYHFTRLTPSEHFDGWYNEYIPWSWATVLL
jgi:hypothetical protein